MARFTNSGDNHFAFAVDDSIGGTNKVIAEAFWQSAGFLEFQH
jgi:hypothetical protein